MGALKRLLIVGSAALPFILFQYYLGAPTGLKQGSVWKNEGVDRKNKSIRFMPCGSFAEHRLGRILHAHVDQAWFGNLQNWKVHLSVARNKPTSCQSCMSAPFPLVWIITVNCFLMSVEIIHFT